MIKNLITPEMLPQIIAFIIMFLCAFQDFLHKKISIIFPISMSLLAIVYQIYLLIEREFNLTNLVISFIPGIVMLLISLLSRNSLGIGDGLMALFLGPVIGIGQLMAGLTIGLFLSAFVSGFLIIFKKAGKKESFAFIPFIMFGIGVSFYVF